MATFITLYAKNDGGGYFKRLCRMISALAARGHRIIYISTAKFPINDKNVQFYRLPSPFKGKLYYIFFFVSSMFMLLPLSRREGKIDGIVVFDALYAIPFILLKLIDHIPLISFIRGNWIRDCESKGRSMLDNAIGTIAYRIGLKLSNKVIFNSESVMREINSQFKIERTDILPNDIDTAKFYNKQLECNEMYKYKQSFRIGYIGNLIKFKHIDLLIAVTATLIGMGYDLELYIVGSGPFKVNLAKMAKERGMLDCCNFLGWRDDINEILNSSIDLLVHPCQTEGAPNIVLEALGAGTLCIATDIPAVKDILKYPDLMFDLSHLSLSKKIARIVNDIEYRNYLNQLCKERRNEFIFNWDERLVDIIMKEIDFRI